MILGMRAVQKVALVAVCLCLFMPPMVAKSEGSAPIDPVVLAEFDTSGEATFLVLFREQADLAPAYEIRDWGERGWFVYERLVATAESSQAGVRALLGAWGAEVQPYWIVNAIQVTTVHRQLISALASRSDIAEIVAPPVIAPPETIEGFESPHTDTIEWNIQHIRAPDVWNILGTRGEGIVIGSLDYGLEYDHPALVNQYRGNLGGGVFDHNYNWYDPSHVCGNPSTAPCETDGHGTFTTGFAVGDDGGPNQIGVAPGARFMMAVIDSIYYGSCLDLMQWMLAPRDLNDQNPRPDLRPHVINNSYGNPDGNNTYWLSAVQAWIAAGIFPVFAMGNEGPSCSSGRSPGDYEETYAVGAHDVNNDIWHYSSRGPSDFGPVKPNIAAPGVGVRSSAFGTYYGGESATSWATPHVTGTVALMWSHNPELIGDVELTRLYLDRSAIDVEDLSCGGEPGNNNVWGEGRLDAFAAVSLVLFSDDFESGNTSAWSVTVP